MGRYEDVLCAEINLALSLLADQKCHRFGSNYMQIHVMRNMDLWKVCNFIAQEIARFINIWAVFLSIGMDKYLY